MPPDNAGFIAYLLSATAAVGLLLFLLNKRGLRDAASLALAACLGLAATYGAVMAWQPDSAAAYSWPGLSLLLALAVTFHHFTRRLDQANAGSGWRWWLGGAVFLAAGLGLAVNPWDLPRPLALGNENLLDRWGIAYLLLAQGWAVFTAAAIIHTLARIPRRVSPLHRNRSLYWSLAAALVGTGSGLLLLQHPVPGSLLQLLGFALAVYTLLTYDLPDIWLAARRLLGFLLSALLAGAVYTLIFLLAPGIFNRLPGENMLALAMGLAALLAFGLNPLLRLLEWRAWRWLSDTRYDHRQALSEYSMSISNILDMDLLATVAVGLIGQAMPVTRGALVAVDQLPGEDDADGLYLLKPISSLGLPLPEIHLPASSPLVLHLRHAHLPLTQYDIDLLPRFRDLAPEDRAAVSQLDMEVYVPVYTKDRWIGLIALGPKISGERFFTEDLALLQTLADQTAVALENARLFDDLKQRNAENERLNSELKEANTRLSRLDQAKSDFINIASHELRTPLTQVIGYNDILSDMAHDGGIDEQTGAPMVENMRKAAHRLEEVVETMFDISKMDTRTLDLNCQEVSPAAIISVALDIWTLSIEQRKQQIHVHGIAGLPPVCADGKRLAQVFSQLVQNAIKSTPDGGRIEINGRVLEDENGCGSFAGQGIEIAVCDNGIGIAAEDLERIFDKFYRVGSILLHSTGDTKFRGAGLGLGLTIARGIVEAHGGCIWAESPGYDPDIRPGAVFRVHLPVNPTGAGKPVRNGLPASR